MSIRDRRAAVLQAHGAKPQEVEELLAYNRNLFSLPEAAAPPDFPLSDELFVEAWSDYVDDAAQEGVFASLQRRLVQLRFPVREGIAKEDGYRAATLKGNHADLPPPGEGTQLAKPDALEVSLHQTSAGKIPVLVTGAREDFVTLTRAFAHRNEADPIPAAQGAVMVAGLNNWDRIARYRRAWEASGGGSWGLEFRSLIQRPENFQDRFIVLSRGPYSAVQAADLGMEEEEWLQASLVIRREHECTHYFTKRIFASMRNNLLDEIIADYVGIVAAAGHYRADWFLRFVGLEAFPTYRLGGRLEVYRGDPPLSDGAFEILQGLVVKAATNLEAFDASHGAGLRGLQGTARVIMGLAKLTIEDLASDDAEAELLRAV